MKEEQIIKDVTVPLDYVPPIESIGFTKLPTTIQQRFLEIVPTPQIVGLKQTCSKYRDECERIQGDFPVDKFEAKKLPVSSPIRFNQFRHNRNLNQVEYIAKPGSNTYDPNRLEQLNIRSDLGFFDLAPDKIHEVLQSIDISKIKNITIKGTIEWEDLKYILEQRYGSSITFDGSVLSDFKLQTFLDLLRKYNHIYITLTLDLPLNYYETLENWAASRNVPDFFLMIIRQRHPLPTERFTNELFDKLKQIPKLSQSLSVNTD